MSRSTRGNSKTKKQQFNRYHGVHEKTFKKIKEILEKSNAKKMKLGGRPSKLTIEQKLLMTLQYWRQYRTYFEIGHDFGISESVAYKNIKWTEDVLVKSKAFSLPNAQKVMKDENLDVVAIDVTETRIERPQKKQKKFIRGRRNIIQLKRK